MKLHTTYNVLTRKYLGRINGLMLISFFIALFWSYTAYKQKEERYGKLPAAAFFFKVEPHSWASATPFTTQ
jgi:hypothetical protein